MCAGKVLAIYCATLLAITLCCATPCLHGPAGSGKKPFDMLDLDIHVLIDCTQTGWMICCWVFDITMKNPWWKKQSGPDHCQHSSEKWAIFKINLIWSHQKE